MTYIQVGGIECFGKDDFGIKILLASSTSRDLTNLTKAETQAIQSAVGLIGDAFTEATNRLDPERQLAIAKERGDLVNLFTATIFVEEIPNGYCTQACCKDKSWLIVTTKQGRIMIGWRKQVINIDWALSQIVPGAKDLFPGEDVTRGDKYIHAWSLEKARAYIAVLESQVLERQGRER